MHAAGVPNGATDGPHLSVTRGLRLRLRQRPRGTEGKSHSAPGTLTQGLQGRPTFYQ